MGKTLRQRWRVFPRGRGEVFPGFPPSPDGEKPGKPSGHLQPPDGENPPDEVFPGFSPRPAGFSRVFPLRTPPEREEPGKPSAEEEKPGKPSRREGKTRKTLTGPDGEKPGKPHRSRGKTRKTSRPRGKTRQTSRATGKNPPPGFFRENWGKPARFNQPPPAQKIFEYSGNFRRKHVNV